MEQPESDNLSARARYTTPRFSLPSRKQALNPKSAVGNTTGFSDVHARPPGSLKEDHVLPSFNSSQHSFPSAAALATHAWDSGASSPAELVDRGAPKIRPGRLSFAMDDDSEREAE
jgi:hypothetical protein